MTGFLGMERLMGHAIINHLSTSGKSASKFCKSPELIVHRTTGSISILTTLLQYNKIYTKIYIYKTLHEYMT